VSTGSRRVLVAMADAGGGHRAVALAISAALGDQHRAEVRIEDVMALSPASFPQRAIRLYPWVIRHAPTLNGIAFHATDHRRVYGALAGLGSRRVRGPVAALLRAWEPAVVVTTHPFANRAVLDALATLDLHIPVLAAVTELVTVHASWFDARLDAYLVASTIARAAVLRHGADPAQVHLTGLPVGPAFGCQEQSAAQARRALGLDPCRFTVLLVGGGEGAGRLARQVAALDAYDLDLQMLVVCGRNVRLRVRLQQHAFRHPARVFGFVDTMPLLMRAADVVVTKGGPTTISEALASERPVIVTSIIPGQEEGNDRLVVEEGVGIGATSADEMVAAVVRLARDPRLHAEMARRAGRAAPRDAAARAAHLIVDAAVQAGRWEASSVAVHAGE